MRVIMVRALVRRALIAAAAAALLVLGAAGPAHPSVGRMNWSRSGRLLAFSTESGLYAANMVQGGVVRLTAHFASGLCAPDGIKVAWSDEGATYVHRSDTMTTVQVAQPGRVAGWSPDSRWVLLEACPPGQATEIYAADADGGGVVPVAPHPASDHDPTWSPEGRWIAFVSERNGSRPGIWVVGWEGSHLTCVTSMFEAAEPAWSPDGSKLAFAGQLTADTPRKIFCLDFSTGKLVSVTSGAEGNCRAPVFVGSHYLKYFGAQPMLADLRSNKSYKLPQGELSPSGTLLAELAGQPGTLDLVSLNGASRRTVATGVEASVWSPDCRWLTYLALVPGPGGGQVRELRISSPNAKGVLVLWSEGVPEAPKAPPGSREG